MKPLSNKVVLKEIRRLHWEPWLERLFNPFLLSFWGEGIAKTTFEELGFHGLTCRAYVYQDHMWYKCDRVFEEMEPALNSYLKRRGMKGTTSTLAKLHDSSKQKILRFSRNPHKNTIEKAREISEMFAKVSSFIWIAHALDHIISKRLEKIVPRYIKSDVDKFIGDASYPKKKTAHGLMDEAIAHGDNPETIVKNFGWIRARDGFLRPFTSAEIRRKQKEIKGEKAHKRPRVHIPRPLRNLFSEVQELVYLRTQRTDVLFELMFLARPIFIALGKQYGIPFTELRYYTLTSLIEGNPKRYPLSFTVVGYKGKNYYYTKPIFNTTRIRLTQTVQGVCAQVGVAQGTVKLVKGVHELGKVKHGDILVTQMTFPSYIAAMHRAAAFVTDEGGLTCHAAIVAREMKKPCVIATKIATHTFKDGDRVEVDATKGIVRKL